MKRLNALSLGVAALAGFVLGNVVHSSPARAQTKQPEHGLYVVHTGSGPGDAYRNLEGIQVVGFQCVTGREQQPECFVAYTK